MRRSWFNGCNMRSLAPRIEIGGMNAASSMESSQQGNGAGALGIRARYARTACNLEHPEWRSPRGAFSDPMDDEGPGGGIRPIPAAGFDADAESVCGWAAVERRDAVGTGGNALAGNQRLPASSLGASRS